MDPETLGKRPIKAIFRLGLAGAFLISSGNSLASVAVLEPRQETHERSDQEPALAARAGGRFLYSSSAWGNYDLAEKGGKAAQEVRLTVTGWDERRPSWWPGFGWLVVINRDRAAGQAALVRGPALGSRILNYALRRASAARERVLPLPQGLPEETELLAAWGRPGRKEFALALMDARGPRVVRLDTEGRILGDYPGARSLAYGPQGRVAVLDRDGDLELLDPESGSATPLTEGPALDLFPSFSPDGDRVLFRRYDRDSNGDGRVDPRDFPLLAEARVDTGKVSDLAPREQAWQDAAYGPEGRVYFTEEAAGIRNIYSLPAQGRLEIKGDLDAFLDQGLENPELMELALERILGNAPPPGRLWARALTLRGRLAWDRGQAAEGRSDLGLVMRSQAEAPLRWEAERLWREREGGPAEKRRGLRGLQKAAGRDPVEAQRCGLSLARLALDQGRFEEALDEAGPALEILPRSADANALRETASQAARALRRNQAAARLDEDLLSGQPSEAQARAAAGRLLLDLGRGKDPNLEACQERMSRALPDLLAGALQMRIGDIYARLGDRDQAALEWLRPAPEGRNFGFWSEEGRLKAADLRLQSGEKAAAETLLEASSSPGARRRLLDLMGSEIRESLEARRYYQAEKAARAAIRLAPSEALFHRALIRGMEGLGRVRYAVGEYEEAVSSHPKDPVLRYGLAYAYSSPAFSGAYYDRALFHLEKALAQDPGLLYGYVTLGWVYEQKAGQKRSPWPLRTLTLPFRLFESVTGLRRYLAGAGLVSPPRVQRDPDEWLSLAAGVYTKSLALAPESDQELRASLLLNMANVLIRLGGNGEGGPRNLEQAVRCYRQRAAIPVAYESEAQKAMALYNLGRAESLLGDGVRARAQLRAARDFFEKQGSKELVFDIANRLHSVAFKRALEGVKLAPEEAWTEGLKALDLARDLKLEAEEVRLLRQLCGTALMRRDPEAALNYGNQAMDRVSRIKGKKKGLFSIKVDFPVTENDPTEAAEGFDKAHTERMLHTWMAEAARLLPDFRLAKEHLEANLKAYSRNRRGGPLLSIIENNLGSLAFDRGLLDEAAEHFAAARDRAHKAGQAQGEKVNDLNLALVRALMKVEEAADQGWWGRVGLDEANQALEKLSGESVIQDSAGLANAGAALALVLGHPDRAAALSGAALKKPMVLEARLPLEIHRALALSALGRGGEAREGLLKALDLAQGEGLPQLEFELHKALGEVAEASGDEPEAAKHFEIAREITELKPAAISAPGARILSDDLSVHRGLVKNLLDHGQNQEAFNQIERMRSLRIAGQVPPRRLALAKDEDREALARVRDQQEGLRELSGRLAEQRADPLSRPEEHAEVRAQYQKQRKEYDDGLFALRNSHPLVASLAGVHPAVAYDAQVILGPDEILLSYLVEEKETWLFALTAETLSPFKLGFGRRELREAVKSARADPGGPGALRLAGMVLAPLGRSLDGKNALYIIPDDQLFYAPWPALPWEGKPLASSRTLSLSPSLRGLILGAENPSFSRVGLLASSWQENGTPALPPEGAVPGERRELKAGLSLEKLKEWAGRFGVLHLGHRFYPEGGSPYRSSIRMGPDSSRDVLRLEDLLGLSLGSSLVALPQGVLEPLELGPGDEISALSTTLLYAGAPTLLLGDRAAGKGLGRVLDDFYNRREEEGAARALALAQKSALERGQPAEDWAGLEIWGFPDLDRKSRLESAAYKAQESGTEAARAVKKGEWALASQRASVAADLYAFAGDEPNSRLFEERSRDLAFRAGDWDRTEYLDRSLESRASERGDKIEETRARMDRGLVLLNRARSKEARALLKSVHDEAEKTGDPDLRRRAGALYQKALIESRDLAAAEKLRREGLPGLQGRERAEALLDLGAILAEDEKPEEALAVLREAEGLERGAWTGQGPDLFLPLLHKTLGYCLGGLGRLREAGEVLDQALGELGPPSGENRSLSAELEIKKAELAFLSGNLGVAAPLQREALEAARASGSAALEVHGVNLGGLFAMNVGRFEEAAGAFEDALATAKKAGLKAEYPALLSNLGLVLKAQGRGAEAAQKFLEALALDRELGSEAGQGDDLRKLGLLSLAAGDAGKAASQFAQALGLAREAHDSRLEQRCELGRAESLEQGGRWKDAGEIYGRVQEAAGRSGFGEELWRARYGLGRCEKGRGRGVEAEKAFREALALVEAQRAQLKVEEYRAGFLRGKLDLYEDLVRLLLDEGRVEDALEALEGSRARGFLDLLAGREGEVPGQGERADVGRLRASLAPGEILLCYGLLVGRPVVFALSRELVKVFPLGADEREIEDLVRRLRDDIGSGTEPGALLKRLGEILLDPAASLISGAGRLGVIPHKSLHYLPFAALEFRGRPLLESASVYSAPSLSILDVCRRRAKKGGRDVLALANPALGEAFDLPFAEKEATAISDAGFQVRSYTGGQALEAAFKSAPPSSIIHFACHGEFLPENPMASGLLMLAGAGEDGRLEAREILDMRRPADLTVLSACQTGLARVATGDEISGLERSFMTAGSRAVLSSLWRVNDVATAVAVKRFYRKLRVLAPAEALREALLETRQAYPEVRLWAGLKLAGAPD